MEYTIVIRKKMSRFLFLAGLSIILISSLVSCDLFNNVSENVIEKKMDEVVAWANSPRVAVSVYYPQEWGSSLQFGTGRCLDNERNEAPRKGYAFTVEFNPNPVYGDAEWVAFKTNDITNNLGYGNNWYINTASITDAFERMKDCVLTDQEVSFSPRTGSRSSVVVNINEAVTIIPRCFKQPRIIMSNPPLNVTYLTLSRDPNREVTITFAAPVDKNTLIFEKGYIEIFGVEYGGLSAPIEDMPLFPPSDGNMKGYFISPPAYDEETYTLTIQPNGEIPDGVVVEITLGNGIKSPGGDVGLPEVFFSYRTNKARLFVDEWQAIYNENSNSINVEWKLPDGALGMFPTARYQVNGGNIIPISLSNNESLTIEGVPRIDDSRVMAGEMASNFYGYTIYLTLVDEPAVIRIWNVPGMKAQKNWGNGSDKTISVVEISSSSDLETLSESVYWDGDDSINKIYVLTDDILLDSPWLPIGDYRDYFQGKFFGNGHAITLGSGFSFNTSSYGDTGIFGVVNNAEIRDLCINYSVPVAFSAEKDKDILGGMAACAGGNTIISNCIVKGTKLKVTSSSETYVDFGGIVGYMETNAAINNSYVNLDLELEKYYSGSGFVGGIAGYCYGGKLQGLSYSGTLTMQGRDKSAGKVIILFGGGIAGTCWNPQMEFCDFSGTIEIKNDISDEVLVGGITGDLHGQGLISDCVSQGKIYVKSENSIFAGGAIGYLDGDGHDKRISIYNSIYKGNSFEVYSGETAERTFVGGFIAALYRFGNVKNCHSDAAPITVSVGAGYLYFGGFSGYIFASDVENCSNNSPIKFAEDQITVTDGIVLMGGFAGRISYNSIDDEDGNEVSGSLAALKNCWSNGDVSSRGAGELYTGALLGYSQGGSGPGERNEIIKCYATGAVIAESNSVFTGDQAQPFATGGLVGYAEYTDISESWAGGKVEARQLDSGFLNNAVGGLVGYHDNGLMENCYALGDVEADNQSTASSAFRAGGLAGWMYKSEMNNCFAGGNVTAKSAGTGAVIAGGLAGYKHNGSTISKSVALGEIITVKGPGDPGNKSLGRIYGIFDGTGASSLNYAYDGMKLMSSTTYGGTATGDSLPVGDPSNNPSSENGEGTSINRFRQIDFWLDTAGLSFNFIGSGGISGIKNYWNFTGLEGRGYPVLAWQ